MGKVDIPERYEEQAMWCSYMPALAFALARSSGPVLEIGIGHFSTPFLHEYCKASGRKLYSVESDPIWRQLFDSRYGNDSHRFGYPISPSAPTYLIPADRFGVVFIDNSPGGEARLNPFLLYRDISDYIVVHDYHRENEEAIKPHINGNWRVFNNYQPPTLLFSSSLSVA